MSDDGNAVDDGNVGDDGNAGDDGNVGGDVVNEDDDDDDDGDNIHTWNGCRSCFLFLYSQTSIMYNEIYFCPGLNRNSYLIECICRLTCCLNFHVKTVFVFNFI